MDKVYSPQDIEQRLLRWVNQPSERGDVAAKARAAVESGRGAAERSLRLVERLLA